MLSIPRFLNLLIIAIALNLAVFSSSATAQLRLVQEVDKNVWRGSQPLSQKEFDQLGKMGIKVIINIQRLGDKKIAIEEARALELGYKFIQIPMDANQTPTDETIEKILTELQRTENHPVYLHCTLGRDRTGLVFALYRVRVQGWTPEAAYKEWVSMGFSNKFLKKLDRYFKDHTGFEGSVVVDDTKKERRPFGGPCEDAILL